MAETLRDKIRRFIRDKIGATTLVGAVIAVGSLIPDWKSRYDFWKDLVTKMAHQYWFPMSLRLLIFAVGVGLIVWDVISRSRSHIHHIRIVTVQSAHLRYNRDHGYYSMEYPSPGHTNLAHLVEVLNVPAPPNKKSKGSGKIRAKLTLNFGKFSYLVSPAAWCGEFFSFVEIEPGETRNLILAVSDTDYNNMRSWRAVVNRRGNSGDAVSTNDLQEIPFLMSGTIMLELVSCETGSVIAQSEIGWAWENQGLTSGPTWVRRLV